MTQESTADSDSRLEAAGLWCLKLAHGALTTAERERFDAWLTDDAENLRAFEDLVGVWRAVKDAGANADLLPLRREALAGFESANRRRWRRPRHARGAVAAAMMVLSVGVALWVGMTSRAALYSTGIGERQVVVLADGSKISLDSATDLSVRYTSQARELRLVHGRAKFEVEADPLRPFTVKAANQVVQALGTAFSVELMQQEVQVILYKGRVNVSRVDVRAATAIKPLTLAQNTLMPGHELTIPISDGPAAVQSIDPVRTLAWEGGQLIFDREPLASAVERVNRYSKEQLAIGDSTAGGVKIDGVFAAGDIEAFVEGVAGVFPVQVKHMNSGRVFVDRVPRVHRVED